MIKVGGRLIWSVVLCCLFWQHTAQAQETLHIQSAQIHETLSYGYSLPSHEANKTELGGEWQSVNLPHALTKTLVPVMVPGSDLGPPTVVTWYRLQVPELTAPQTPRFIYVPRWKTDGQIAVYVNNQLLYQSHANVFWNGWNIPLWIALENTAGAANPREILIRIVRPRESGGGISTVWLGEDAQLSWRFHLRYMLQAEVPYMSSVGFLVAGLFSLVVWFRRRREPLYLLFFGVSLASFLRTLHYHVGENRLLVSDEWFSWLTVNALFWLIAVVHFFLNHLHQRPLRRVDWPILMVTVGVTVVTLPIFTVLPSVYILAPLTYILLMFTGTTVGAFGWFQSRKSQTHEGLLLSGWILLGMVLWLYDWLLQSNYIDIEGIYLGPYTNFFGFLIFLRIIFRRYVGAIDEVKQINASLEVRLLAREVELQENYRSQREAAHRQTLSNERQRVMQDMHDGMGSSLRTALLEIEKGKLDGSMVAEVLKGCIDDLKLAVDAMEPVQADLLLLLATLRYRLGPRLEGAGIALRWEIENVPALEWLDPRNSLHILRILQEAFTNIIKHAQATVIRVATRVDTDWVIVTIADNGTGFDVEKGLSGAGRGLGNQRRRAEFIGAEIHWDSNNAGTCLTLWLPQVLRQDA